MAISVDLKGFPGATGAVVAAGDQVGSWVCSNGWINATVDILRKTFSGSDPEDVASQIATALDHSLDELINPRACETRRSRRRSSPTLNGNPVRS
jgi:U3 small nucleolar ribonucleoprotein component